MTTKVSEAGRKISSVNAAKIKAAIETLTALITDEQAEGEVGSKESIMPGAFKTEGLDDVRKGLQALIDLLPPVARENLEGDGDGDNDAQAIVQGHVGDLLFADNESLREATMTTKDRKALSDSDYGYVEPGAGDDVSKKHFPIHDAAHVRNALARIAQGAAFGKQALPKVKAAASKFGIDTKDPKEAASLFIHHVFTNPDGTIRSDPSMEQIEASYKATAPKLIDEAKTTPKDEEDETTDDPEDEEDTSHMDAFGNLTPMAQRQHLTSTHGVKADDPNLKFPRRRAAMHQANHSTKESADIGLEPVDVKLDFLPLVEKALTSRGTIQVKMIRPGWGSSGYYKSEVLERDAPTVFPTGTKMYWNHPTTREERERPERDLRDLAAVTVSDAAFMRSGPEGPGVYAEAKPIEAYKSSIEELAPYIGASIRTGGLGSKGEAEGRKGVIIERLVKVPGTSCDFVTEPGAGGKVLSLFEAAGRRQQNDSEETDEVTEQEVKDLQRKLREAEARNAQLAEKILLRETKDYAEEELKKIEGLPPMTIDRIAEAVTFDPPVDEDGELDKKELRAKIKARVQAESRYLESVLRSGRPRGMGNSPSLDGEEWGVAADGDETSVGGLSVVKSMEADFIRLGLSESVAKHAANGR